MTENQENLNPKIEESFVAFWTPQRYVTKKPFARVISEVQG